MKKIVLALICIPFLFSGCTSFFLKNNIAKKEYPAFEKFIRVYAPLVYPKDKALSWRQTRLKKDLDSLYPAVYPDPLYERAALKILTDNASLALEDDPVVLFYVIYFLTHEKEGYFRKLNPDILKLMDNWVYKFANNKYFSTADAHLYNYIYNLQQIINDIPLPFCFDPAKLRVSGGMVNEKIVSIGEFSLFKPKAFNQNSEPYSEDLVKKDYETYLFYGSLANYLDTSKGKIKISKDDYKKCKMNIDNALLSTNKRLVNCVLLDDEKLIEVCNTYLLKLSDPQNVMNVPQSVGWFPTK